MLYMAGKELMQEIANSRKKEFTYGAATEDEKIRNWCRNAGNKIFHWTDEREASSPPHTHVYYFDTTITPNDVSSTTKS